MESTRDEMREKLPALFCCTAEDKTWGFDFQMQKEGEGLQLAYLLPGSEPKPSLPKRKNYITTLTITLLHHLSFHNCKFS